MFFTNNICLAYLPMQEVNGYFTTNLTCNYLFHKFIRKVNLHRTNFREATMKYSITFAISFGILMVVNGQTTVPPGAVYGTWTSYSTYQITGNIYIPHDSTLTIEPGVKVEFQGHYELKVMGRLLAEGTQTDSILFTVNDTTGYYLEDTTLGGWNGIRIYDIEELNDSTKLAYCRLEYGKAIGPDWNHSTGGALYAFGFNKISVSHCLFFQNKACTYDDIESSGGAAYFEFSNISFTENTFSNNKAYRGGGIYFYASGPVFNNNLFLNNQSGFEGGGNIRKCIRSFLCWRCFSQ